MSEQALHPAQQHIQEIMAQEKFDRTHTDYEWRIRDPEAWWRDLWEYFFGNSEDSSSEPFPWGEWFGFLGGLLEIFLWAGFVVLVVLAIYFLIKHPRVQALLSTSNIAKPVLRPAQIMDMLDAEPSSLEASAQQALALWQAGQGRAALSLLYRGALQTLQEERGLVLPDSATEGECLSLVRGLNYPELSQYFAELTRTWQNVAYAERLPSDAQMQQLCQRWEAHFSLSA